MPKKLKKYSRKKQEIKEKVRYYCKKGVEKLKIGLQWIKDNPQAAAILATSITGVASMSKKGFKVIAARREKYNKERYVYDHSAKAYLKIKRRLKNNDIVKINEMRRLNPGMKMAECLNKLNLLD